MCLTPLHEYSWLLVVAAYTTSNEESSCPSLGDPFAVDGHLEGPRLASCLAGRRSRPWASVDSLGSLQDQVVEDTSFKDGLEAA